jgi:hypothetical protein
MHIFILGFSHQHHGFGYTHVYPHMFALNVHHSVYSDLDSARYTAGPDPPFVVLLPFPHCLFRGALAHPGFPPRVALPGHFERLYPLYIDMPIRNFLIIYTCVSAARSTNLLYALSAMIDQHLDIYPSSPC